MLVTGGTHAGEFLRLLGNGHEYGIDRLSYAYQEEGGIAEALGLAERFVGGDRVVVMLADNVVERCARPSSTSAPGGRADPARRRTNPAPAPSRRPGARRRRVTRIVEKPEEPAERVRVTGIYFYDADRSSRSSRRSSRRPAARARDHRRQQLVRRAGTMEYDVLEGFWGTRASRSTPTTPSTTSSAPTARTAGVIDGSCAPAAAVRGRARLVHRARRESSCRSRCGRRTSRSRAQGVIRGLHYHERGQDDLFVCLSGTARVVVLDRERRDLHRGHRRREPGRALHPGRTRTATRRSPTCSSSTTSPRSTTPDPDEHEISWDDPRVVHLWSTSRRSCRTRRGRRVVVPAPAAS